MADIQHAILETLLNTCKTFIQHQMQIACHHAKYEDTTVGHAGLLEWTVTAGCKGSSPKEIWFSMDGPVCSAFMNSLGLPEPEDTEMFTESAKEFMNFIVGHADHTLYFLDANVLLAGIHPYSYRPFLDNTTCHTAELPTDSGKIKIITLF